MKNQTLCQYQQCPHCGSYGVLKCRRTVLEKLLQRTPHYACIDCGKKMILGADANTIENPRLPFPARERESRGQGQTR